ncbi:MAG: DUF6263 family protein [Bacteroidota bacterium]
MKQSITLSLLAIVSILFTACSTKPLALKMTAEPSKKYVYRSSNMTETNIAVMGMDQKVVMDQSTEQEYDIQKVNDDGSMDIKLTTLSMKMEQVNPMMSMTFDSENPDKNEPADMVKGMKALVGKEYTLKMSPQGKILELETEGGAFSGAFDNLPNGEAMEEQMEAQFGTATIKQSMSQMTGFFPEEPVKVGDTWMKSNKIESGMAMVVETTYILKERKDGIAYIDFSAKVTTDPEADGIEMMGMQMKYDLAGTQSGTIQVDEKTGWTKKTKGKQEMKGKMNMSGGPTGEMSADMNIVSEYVYEQIEK